ncbi:MAG: hypothetical protein ACKVOJ_13540 [Sphingomonadaceae bacterium]
MFVTPACAGAPTTRQARMGPKDAVVVMLSDTDSKIIDGLVKAKSVTDDYRRRPPNDMMLAMIKE